MSRPNPDGWKGGSEDFTYTRNLEGRRAVNVETDEDLAADLEWRRNSRTPRDGNLSGDYD